MPLTGVINYVFCIYLKKSVQSNAIRAENRFITFQDTAAPELTRQFSTYYNRFVPPSFTPALCEHVFRQQINLKISRYSNKLFQTNFLMKNNTQNTQNNTDKFYCLQYFWSVETKNRSGPKKVYMHLTACSIMSSEMRWTDDLIMD